ncbi:hypothetical protein ACFU6S_14325 [Streptomyces sp. NPDC057456]|uniref:hypothetical protein n=1 Tax=Streptomyces sp. NPDC057456 TaxID=3346139 RepID=UPI0036993A03
MQSVWHTSWRTVLRTTLKGAAEHGDLLWRTSAPMWRHAMAAASGAFHTESQKYGDSDPIVKWSDGG